MLSYAIVFFRKVELLDNCRPLFHDTKEVQYAAEVK